MECLTTHAQHRRRPVSIGGTGPPGAYGASGPVSRQRRRRRLAGGAHSECALCHERATQFATSTAASDSTCTTATQRQRRRKQTQRSASTVRASTFTEYRPYAQACVTHLFFPTRPPIWLLQQQRRSSAALFAAAAFGGDWGAGSGRAVARLHRRLLSRAHAGAARAGAELSRGAGTLLPAVRSGHWCLSSPPRQPGSGGAAAVEWLIHPRPTPAPPAAKGGTFFVLKISTALDLH